MENYLLANCTDTGRVRSVNEDTMISFDCSNGKVFVVCDGMGGQNAGDVASQLAATVIKDILSDNTFPTPEEAITRSIIAANQAILHRAMQDDNLTGMGSTCVMVILKDGKVYYGSIGDSRIYYISNGMIRQVTKDQSYVQTLVDEGRISKEAAEYHQDKNQITNALGIENMTPPVICQIPITPEPGSIVMLCSDGLSGMINNNAILTTLSNRDLSLNERAQQLVNLANDAGGLDNITLQLIEFPMNADEINSRYPANHSSGAYVNPDIHKNRSTIFIIIISLILIAIICVCLYVFFHKQKEEPTIVVPAKEIKKDTTPKQETKDVGEEKIIIVKEEPKKPIIKKERKKPVIKPLPENDGTKKQQDDVVEAMRQFKDQHEKD